MKLILLCVLVVFNLAFTKVNCASLGKDLLLENTDIIDTMQSDVIVNENENANWWSKSTIEPQEEVEFVLNRHDDLVVQTSSTETSLGEISFDEIPDSYKILLVYDVLHCELKDNEIQELKFSLSQQLQLPMQNIQISIVDKETGVVEVYVIRSMIEDVFMIKHPVFILLPSDEILKQISLQKLRTAHPCIFKVKAKQMEAKASLQTPVKPNTVCQIFRDMWSSWRMSIMICFSLLVIFVMVILMMILCYRWEERQKNFKAEEESRQILFQPVIKPIVKEADFVQPESRDSLFSEVESEYTSSPCRSPLHMRTKGLLERRGSNASLTLDLSRSPENVSSRNSPSCNAKDVLTAARNPLSRQQLRNCLKNVKSLHTEYWEIPMNHPEKTDIPGSGTKNRYKTILPNEHTRVKLPETDNDPLASYINANYIRGYDLEEKVYIATQGPMAHTVVDFWQMVWMEKTPAIVMITKLKENNKVKCESYIPDCAGSYGTIQVTVLRVLPRDGYTIRELFVQNGAETRKIFHFWYTMWPDHKTPSTAKQLVSMALEIESLKQNNVHQEKGPVIVHCSAGIGRTGCFIAIAIGIQQLLEENSVDVLGIVCSLRLDRGGMVQTAEQYEFVHQALNLFENTLPNGPGD